ncbi:MAG: hypothetical protein U0176_07965 [Bacteroidia bacterium]
MEPNVNFLIRAQAVNGMFLGPDSFNGAIITIINLSNGETLAQGLMNTGDSGSRSTTIVRDMSPYTIVTPGNPSATTYYVVADTTTVCYSGAFYIPEETNIEVRVSEPLGGDRPNAESSIQLRASPGQDLNQGAGIVVPVPGLWVQPEIIRLGTLLRVRAKVTMMCGCEINANSPWLPEDFVATATVTDLDGEKGTSNSYAMTFQINSQFFANVTIVPDRRYAIRIEAQQISSGLTGSALAEI